MDSEFGCQLPGFETAGRFNDILGGVGDARKNLMRRQAVGEKTPALIFLKIFVDQPKIFQD